MALETSTCVRADSVGELESCRPGRCLPTPTTSSASRLMSSVAVGPRPCSGPPEISTQKCGSPIIQSTLWTTAYPHPSLEGLRGCTLNGRSNQGPGRGKRCPGVPCLPLPQLMSLGWEMRCRTAWGSKVSPRGRRWTARQAATHLAGPIIEVCSPGQGHEGRDG